MRVIADNHLGDWGADSGILIRATAIFSTAPR